MCDGCGCAGTTELAAGAASLLVDLERHVLSDHNARADSLRSRLRELGAHAVNIVGSPGSGKTELCVALIRRLGESRRCLVVEGDLATDNDARRIAEAGAPVFQVQTGTACHLTTEDLERALDGLPLGEESLVLVENVGNLVCPSMFDLGESMRIVCLSVTEGTDKPQKYPVSFREADLAVITKVDLLEHVDFDLPACREMIDQIKPGLRCIPTSARSGEGVDELAAAVSALYQPR